MKKVVNKLFLNVKSLVKIKFFLIPIFLLVVGSVLGQVTYSTANSNYTQTFDNLYGTVPANNTAQAATILPTGWLFVEAGLNANTTLRNDNGSSGTGDTYFNGATTSNERSLGSYASGSLTSQFGVFFTNTTGSTLTEFTLTYTGEQWKDGGNAAAILNKLSFAYAINPTSLTSGTYNNVTSLDFTALVNNTSADVTTDGNAANRRTTITFTVTGISWANNQTLYLRWTDLNDSGNDDNLSIDDITFSSKVTASAPVISTSGTLSAVNTTYGTASVSPATFSVSGADMSAGITVTPPAGFQVSTSSIFASGIGTNASPITVGASGTIAPTPVYVRLAAATAVGSYSGNIALSSSGATGVNVATVSSSVSAKAVTISGLTGSNKVYDGLTTATFTGSSAYSGLVNSETFSVIGTPTASFATATVGNSEAISVTGYTAPSANYTLTQPSLSGNITTASLTISGLTGANKVYDGLTSSTFTGTAAYSGLVNSETFSVTGTPTTSFATATVGNSKAISVTGYTAPSANYTLTQPSLTANITTKALTIASATAQNKTYDGNTTATITGTLAGVVSPDGVNLSLSGTFASAAVGSAIAVTSTSTISGTAAANYTLTQPTGLTADISAYPIPAITSSLTTNTIYGIAATTYTITASNSPTSFNASGLPSGLTVNTSTGAITGTPTATGNFNVTISATNTGGSGSATLVYTIQAKTLTVSNAVADNKQYDRTTNATISGSTLVGIFGTDTVSISNTGSFANANVGNGIAVTSTQTLSGADASKYILIIPTGLSANISAKNLTISGATAQNKTYDGNTTATITGTLAGVVSPDVVSLSLAGTFASATIGSAIAVTSTSTITGTDATNYSLTQPTGLTANITPLSPVISSTLTATAIYGTVASTYTITATNSPTSYNATGLPSGLSVNSSNGEITGTPTVAGTFNVTISATNAGGTGNATLVYTVSPKNLTVSGASAVSKIYDRTNAATINNSTLVGIIGVDVVTISGTSTFAAASVGSAIAVTSTQTLGGADAAKYTLTSPTGLTADITPKPLTVSTPVAQNKFFDGNTSATITGTLSGVIAPDVVTFNGTGIFASTAIGNNIVVTSTSTITGADATNYSLTQPTALTANITAPTLYVNNFTGISACPTNGNIPAVSTNATGTPLTRNTITCNATANVFNSTTLNITSSPSNTSFIEFSVSASSGNVLNLTSLQFYRQASNSAPNLLELRYSTDGFATSTPWGASPNSPTTGSVATWDFNDFSTSNAGTVTFRFYPYGTSRADGTTTAAATTGTFRLDDVTVFGNVTVAPIITGTATTTAFTTTYGTVSAVQTFTIGGSNLTANITANAPTGFEVASNGNTYGSTATFTQSGGSANGTLSIRLKASAAVSGSYNAQTIALTSTGATTVNITTAATGNTVTAKGLTISVSANNKAYDGTTNATLGTPSYVGLANGETFSVTGTPVASFASANVGTGIVVSVSGYAAPSTNYTLSAQPTATANITAVALTITGVTANNKAYDGTTAVTLNTTSIAYSGLVNGETFSVSGTATATFASANVGTAIAVTISGFTVPSTNYTITQPSASANISAVALTITGVSANNKTYDGTTNSTLSGTAAYSGLVNGEVYAVTGTPTATFTSANVANGITVAIAGYTAPSNYTLTQPSATANITAKNLTIDNATAQNKTFDSTTTATITGSLAGVIAPDVVTLTLSGTFATSTAGTGIAVTSTSSIGGAAVANYALTQPTGLTADISAYPLPVITSSLTASESYGNTAATYTITASNNPTSFNATGLPAGLSINTSTGAITGTPTATPGNYNVTISATNIGGTGAAILVYTVTPKTLTLTPATADATKVYDGTTAATVSGASISGVIGTDSVSVSANGTFADKNIGTAKTITINYSLNGTDAAKYTLASNSSTSSGNITALGISTTGATAQNKTYDNTTAAVISGTTLVGVLNGDVVTISTSGTFAQATIGSGIVVTSSQTLGGADAGNYTVSLPTGLTANISSVALTVSGASAANKTYDASTTASISGAILNGVVAGDIVTLITTATFNNKNVGTGKTVTIAYSLNGADAGKYTLATATATTTANITALGLTISGASVTAKTYDGNTSATVSGGTLNEILSGDLVTFSGTAAYSDANAGIGKTVTTALVLSGADAINYTLTQPSLTGDINKANQTITFGALAQKYTTDADFNLTATSPTSGTNAITYSSANTAVASVTLAGLVDVLTAGSTTITATQAASANYNVATASQSLVVVSPAFTAGRLVVARVGATGQAIPPGSVGTPIFLSEFSTTGTAGLIVPLPTTTVGNVNTIIGNGSSTSETQLNLSVDGQYLTLGGYDATVGATSVHSTGSNRRVIARVNNSGTIETTVLPSTFYTSNNFRSVTTVDGSRYWTGGTGGSTGVATVLHTGNTTPTTSTTVFNTITNIRTVSIYNGQLYYGTGSGTTGVYKVGTNLPITSTTSTIAFPAGDPYAYYFVNRGGSNVNCYVAYATGTGIYKFSSPDNGTTWTARGNISTTVGAYGVVAKLDSNNDVEIYATTQASILKLTDTAAFNADITGTFTTIASAPTNTFFKGLAFAPVLITPLVTNTTLTASGTVDTLFTNYTITAVNSPETFNATGLPTGLAINTATGVISGTPTAGGTFNVTISATNGAGTSATKTLVITIAKANQVITFNTLAGKDITDQDFTLSATSTSSANPIVYTSSDASIATISGNTVHIVGNTGNVTITASQVGNDNYNVATSVDQILTVSNALATNQTITFAALASVTYGDAPFSLSATSDSGLAVTFTSSNLAVATVSGTTVTIVGVGTTNITASQGGNNNVNPATNVIQSLVVNQKQLTIINAVVTNKTYDATSTATVTSGTLSGIVGSDAVTFSGTATFNDVNVNTGISVTTTFTLSGADVAKYTLLQPSLTGTIVKAEQVIVFTTIQPKTTFDLDAVLSSFSTTSSINPVTFTSSDPSVLSILNPSAGVYNLHVVGEGFATITASQGASANYNAAPNVNQTIIVRTVLYRNQFAGASACPTNGNTAYTAGNTTGTAANRSTMVCNATANVFNSTTLNATATVNDASYIEFSVAATNGYKLNIKSVSFFRQASNSAPNQLEVRYSTDSFTTSTSWGAAPLTPKTDSGSIATWDFADFTTTLGATVTFRIYPYGTQRADLTGASAASGTFRIDDLTIDGNLVQVITWNGTSWSNGSGPTIADEAEINGNYSTAASPAGNGTFSAKKLTINSGLFTVKSGTNLTVADQLVNSVANTFAESVQTAGFKIENNGNLVQTATTNTNIGAIVSSRINTSMRRLDYSYWSSPTASATYSLKNFSPLTMSLTSTPQGGASRFYSLSESDNAFIALDPLATYFDASNIAKGFSIRAPNNFPTNGTTAAFNADFIGVPNNGNITIAVTNSGLLKGSNLIGNPYPSTIDTDTFLTYSADNVTFPNAGTIYFWTHSIQNAQGTANYASCNLSGKTAAAAGGPTPNGKIQVGQGFILKKAASSTVVFNSTMRVGNNDGQFFRTAATEKHRIWLNLATDTTPLNQIMVGYIEGTTLGFDDSYDGKLINSGSSIASAIDNENYVIQARPTPFVNTDEVPLNFKAATAGSYTLSIDHVDGLFLGEQNVYLKDKLLNITHDIKAGAYTFTSNLGTFNNRFEVVYINSTLNISTPTFDANSVIVYKDDNKVLNINAGKVVMKNVKIYDVRGRLVYEKSNINSTTTALKDLKAEQEVLLVKITSDDNKVVTKKVVF